MESTLRSLPALVEFVRAAPLAVVATVNPDGAPEAALVSIAITHDGDLLFNSSASARKVSNIGDGARVALVVGCAGPVSLQIEGRATVQSGAARIAAGEIYNGAFPGSRALAAGFSIVRVVPEWIRQYDTAVEPPSVEEGRPG
ncbi:MAG: pyridoxamine 5'-phosphate oxidase family protein, partial [Pseudonocardia sediminis]